MHVRLRQAILVLFPLGLLLAGALSFSRQSSPPVRPPGRTPTDIEKIFDDLIRKTVLKAKRLGCLSGGRNEWTWNHFLRGRMLALVYPEIMEGLLTSSVTDASLDPSCRLYCMALLGELSTSGRQASQLTLHALAASPEEFISDAALRQLARIDLQGTLRALYLSKCREGDWSWSGFDAVACWNDPATVQEMERIVAASPGNQLPESSKRFNAQEVLEKLRILESPDWGLQLEKILGETYEFDYRFNWALQVARIRRLPGTLDALRRRLDRIENPLSPNASPAERADFAEMERLAGNTSIRLALGYSPGFPDFQYDDALMAYAELGGPLNEIERERLTLFGYWGDVRQRLEEVLSQPEPDP